MMGEQVRRGRVWKCRLAAFLGSAVLLAGLAGVAGVNPRLLKPNAYASDTSIETRPAFHDPALLARAWALPVAAYRRRPYEYQSNPSFCGPPTVANLLRSLGVDFSQADVLRGTAFQPWFGVLLNGLTLDELADLIRRRLDRPVHVVRGLTSPAFRGLMKSGNDPDRRLIVNFHCGPVFGRGAGHFSPILGYLPDADLVFVGDVNGDYRPFLIDSESLWRAVATRDSTSGKTRGLLIVDTTRH
ncbi:phytochelatin synthase family protein [Methylobacterium sp. J-092]|uniref:phytochelatin synthase family protein n=1 Tax=Methylobacterium sp. J-092 TaxID=2836667 RepID=UPI001FBB8620|nr:phytochelatin synthase family protein [Methylobacterium sp. J-092]MCJ2006641.1 phytochelatin synthase family protein [Methylobacterium sp. J-092]